MGLSKQKGRTCCRDDQYRTRLPLTSTTIPPTSPAAIRDWRSSTAMHVIWRAHRTALVTGRTHMTTATPTTAPPPDLWCLLLGKLRLDGPKEVGSATPLHLAAVPYLNDGLVRLVKLTRGRSDTRCSKKWYHVLTPTPTLPPSPSP